MKLKYYLRGMGIGIILTAIVMGFALGGRKATISDAEVIERAKALGMVDPTSGVLNQGTNGADTDEENTTASGETLDQTGEEISEEIDQEFASNSESVYGLDEEVVQGEEETESETAKETAEASKSTEDVNKSDTVVSEEVVDSNEVEPDNSNEKSSEDQAATDISSADDSVNETVTSANNSEVSETASNTETATNNTSGLGAKTTVTKTITIPGGLGSDQVAAILQREGIVDSAYSFNQYLCEHRMDRVIRSGQKTIPAGSTYQDIANIICK